MNTVTAILYPEEIVPWYWPIPTIQVEIADASSTLKYGYIVLSLNT